MREKLTIDIVKKYQTTSISTFDNYTEKRDYFLFFLFCFLADLSSDKSKLKIDSMIGEDINTFVAYLSEMSSKLRANNPVKKVINDVLTNRYKVSEHVISEETLQTLSKKERDSFIRTVHFEFDDYIKLTGELELSRFWSDVRQSLIDDNGSIIGSLLEVLAQNNVIELSSYDAVQIYTHVLLRLQAAPAHSYDSVDFIYQEIPSDFVDLIMEMERFDKIDSVYAPFEVTTEQSLYLALEYPDIELRVESVHELPRHSNRKFALAQANNFDSSYTYCLDSLDIKGSYYDASIFMLQPNAVKDVKSGKFIERSLKKGEVNKDYSYVRHVINKLNENGKAFVVIGNNGLFQKSDYEQRQYLIDNNFVDVVISFPANIMNFCPLPVTMLIINKAKKTEDVLFINANEFQKEEAGRVVIEDASRLAEEYKTRPVSSFFSFTVTNQRLARRDYSLRDTDYMNISVKETHNLKELSVVREHKLNQLIKLQKEIDELVQL